MKEDNIYLDDEGYQKFLELIEQLKTQYKQIQSGRRESFDAGAGDGWDSPEFEEIEREERRILGQLQKMYAEKERIIIIKKHNEEQIVDIGDILVVDITFSDDDSEEDIFKLVGGDSDFTTDIKEISVNSPIGGAVYKKKIGEKCFYTVEGRDISLVIKKKLYQENENENPKTKKLV